VPVAAAAQYVGSDACASCHRSETGEWRASQHHDAMAVANQQSVLGNFNGATFAYAGTTTTFSRRDGVFYVRTDGRDGTLADFPVKYTFGVYPLQQYLVEFPDGRVQALSVAWDARPRKDGGQRWFHLYPTERITHDDELHWTRPSQNWNFMCADCHSTAVRKNYDSATDRFQTRWAEISVGCEGCHGPGSRHLEWTGKRTTSDAARRDSTKGLSARLDERLGVSWIPNVASGNARRSQPRTTEREIEVCAQCHARRGQIADGYEAGKPLLDYYRPAFLSSPLYFADGQQRGEVYSWGSFLQSRMYANGVTCSDCHDPHSGKLRAEGNAICASCHLASKYDAPSHHNHQPASAGATCIACHMPATTYMVLDPRHDHSLRVPRPDLSVTLGTPNACSTCHKDRDARWAATKVNAWYGHEPQGYQRFAEAFAASGDGARDAQALMRTVAEAASQPAIARATAFESLDAFTDQTTIDALAKGLRDPNALVRLGSLQALAAAPLNIRASLAGPLLSDPLKALRIEAASLLAPLAVDQRGLNEPSAFGLASSEFVESQRYNADRPEGRVNIGTFYGNRGDAAKSEDEIRAAIRLDPFYLPAYVNLADLYRVSGRDADGERVLRQGLAAAPQSGALHHALGLALVRLKRTDEALQEFERATVLEPHNARFTYVYGVALHSTGHPEAAVSTLEKGLLAHPGDSNIVAALASFRAERGGSATRP
jgi:predicted CXXCH cytochrome family protein